MRLGQAGAFSGASALGQVEKPNYSQRAVILVTAFASGGTGEQLWYLPTVARIDDVA
jgi:hypothetical protein